MAAQRCPIAESAVHAGAADGLTAGKTVLNLRQGAAEMPMPPGSVIDNLL